VGSPQGTFDLLARDYDREFTLTNIGMLMRQAVWRRLEQCFRPSQRVIELNCGTGEDAVFLGRRGIRVLATDASTAMIEEASAKVRGAGLAEAVEVRRLSIEELCELKTRPFDGALSNFGGLNCVDDLRSVGRALADQLRPGATAVLCVMGPVVPWEWAWFLARGEVGKAFRRLRSGGSDWRGVRIRYPGIFELRSAFLPSFRMKRAAAVGALLPPPYARVWAEKHPTMLGWLNRWERRLETVPPLPWLADHYVLELERV
jgi:SAM-dependent methyltransferase